MQKEIVKVLANKGWEKKKKFVERKNMLVAKLKKLKRRINGGVDGVYEVDDFDSDGDQEKRKEVSTLVSRLFYGGHGRHSEGEVSEGEGVAVAVKAKSVSENIVDSTSKLKVKDEVALNPDTANTTATSSNNDAASYNNYTDNNSSVA